MDYEGLLEYDNKPYPHVTSGGVFNGTLDDLTFGGLNINDQTGEVHFAGRDITTSPMPNAMMINKRMMNKYLPYVIGGLFLIAILK